jgi:hypothetical protein
VIRRALAVAVVLAVAAAAVLPATAPATPGQLVAAGIPYATNVAFDARGGGMWVTSGAPFHEAGDGVWYVPRAGARPIHVIRETLTALGVTGFRGRLYVVSQRGARTGIVARYSGFDGRRTLFRTGAVVRFFPGFNPSPGAGGAARRAAAWSASPR